MTYNIKSKKAILLLISMLMVLSIIFSESVSAASEEIKTINILSFNDYHGQVLEGKKEPGIAKFARVIKDFKDKNKNTIVVAAGDLYQGSAISNLNEGAPINEMINNLQVVASAVGNHEFDWGIDKIEKWSKEGNFEWLASNIYDKNTLKPVTFAKPYKMIEVDGVKIGLIGIATPETTYKTKATYIKDLEFRDPIESAREWAEKLKSGELEEGKADIVIALTHLGAFQDKDSKIITGEAADLAKASSYVDAVIAAHTHQTVAGKVGQIPVVSAYYNGRAYGRLEIKYDLNTKIVEIIPYAVDLISSLSELKEDEEVKAIAEKYEKLSGPKLNEVLAVTDKDLVHDKLSGPSILGEWICEVMAKATESKIAITNGGGIRTSFNKGNITMGNLYEVMPFDNTLFTMELTGADIKNVIENGIGNNKIGWVQVSGLNVKYDLARPFKDRITEIKLINGTKLDMNKYYKVVTNDFMASNGDEYDFSKGKNKLDTNIPVRDVLVNELKASKKLSLVKKNYLKEEKKLEGPTIPVIPQKSIIYTVKLGDTLYSIGAKYNIDYKEIGEINNIDNLNLIFVGQKLIIPQP